MKVLGQNIGNDCVGPRVAVGLVINYGLWCDDWSLKKWGWEPQVDIAKGR
jgi:hypothetical protein